MAQFVQDGVVYEDLGNGNVRVVGYADAPQGQPAPMTIGSPKPREPEKPQNIQRKDGSIVQVYADGTMNVLSGPVTETKGDPAKVRGTEEQRGKALQAFTDAAALRRIAADLRKRYEAGPGATKGIAGVQDFFPTEGNTGFDTAAQRARGYVKRSLGFTGGEGNVLAESEALYSPYLPNTSNWDGEILSKINALEQLAGDAERQATTILGGRPDAAGNIIPIQDTQQAPMLAPAGNIPPAGGSGPQGPDRSNPIPRGPVDPNFDPTGRLTLGTGRFATDRDKQVQQQLNAMLNSGATEEQLLQAITSTGYAPYYNLGKIREVVQYRDRGGKGAGFALPTTGERSAFEKGVNTALTWEDPYIGFSPGTAAASGVNALGAGTLEAIAPQAFDEMRANNPVSAFTGDVAGIVGATSAIGKIGAKVANRFAPQALTAGGRFGNVVRSVAPDAVYGAAYGGITEGDPLTGAATATLGSGAGQLGGKVIQKGLQGVSDPAVRYLSDKGIPLTLGQIMGNRGIVGKGLNAAESHPVLGPLLGAGRDRSLAGWNKAKLNEIIEPVGGSVTRAGSEGLEQAQQAVGQGFRNALDGVTVSPDAQFISEAQAAMQAGAAVPKFGEDFTYVMNQEVGPIFGQGGQLTGPQLQNAMQALGKIQGDFNRNPEALATYAGNAAGQVDDALTGLVNRQAPDVMPAYDSAKQAYSQLVPFENAAISAINSRAGEGIVTPTQYIRAMTNNTKNYGGRAAAARGKNLTDLDRFGQEVLPSTVPETGARLAAILPFVPTGLLAGGSAAAGMNGGDAATVGSLAALAALTSPLGARLAQHTLVTRPEPVRKLGGMFGGRKAKKGLSSIGVATAPLLIGQ